MNTNYVDGSWRLLHQSINSEIRLTHPGQPIKAPQDSDVHFS